MTLSKDQILSASDRKSEEVQVPEWGGSVLVRGMSGEDRDAYQASLTKRIPNPKTGGFEVVPDQANANARFAAKVIVDDQGNRMFTDQDAINLGGKSAAALQRVFDVGARLSGLTDDAVEDAEGNSETAPSGCSGSDSPESSAAQ